MSNVRRQNPLVFNPTCTFMNKLLCGLLAIAALLLGGCATKLKMPLQNEGDQVSVASKSLYLMAVTVENPYKDHFAPTLNTINVVRDDGPAKADPMIFAVDSKGTYVPEEDSNVRPKYLIRMELAPGKYTIRGFAGSGRAFPIQFTFFAPLHSPVTSGAPGVYYLGAVDAAIRQRTGTEFKAGSSIPLIDQAVAGMSTGTFDIVITDRYNDDVALFRKVFPALERVDIQRSVLPPFDRQRAQRYWEEN